MTPTLRKLNLTAHVVFSVGWVGSVAGFLTLSIAGLMSRDAETVRSAYIAMNLIGQFVIVPLSLAALLTGIIQSLGTEWGLFRLTGNTGVQLMGDAALGLLVLLVITILSFYKPWGLTRYGRRIKAPQRPETEIPAGLRVFLAIVGVLAAVGFVLSHLTGHGFHHGH